MAGINFLHRGGTKVLTVSALARTSLHINVKQLTTRAPPTDGRPPFTFVIAFIWLLCFRSYKLPCHSDLFPRLRPRLRGSQKELAINSRWGGLFADFFRANRSVLLGISLARF
jgi:hypothetical protein